MVFFLVSSTPVMAQEDDGNTTNIAPSCPIDCLSDAPCEIGSANYSFHPREPNGAMFTFLQKSSREGWFCDCPDGLTGIRCGRPYTICPPGGDEDEPLHVCYHGGKCIDGLENSNSSGVASHQRFCDCTDASHDDIPYYGKYCEIKGAVPCAPGSEIFCTANGSCKDGFETKAHPCTCREGHRGPHCEFLRGQVPDCVLSCQNGGECTLGLKDFEEAKYQSFWATHNGNYQYCVSVHAKQKEALVVSSVLTKRCN